MTTAEMISEIFGDDGLCFEAHGRSLAEVCEEHCRWPDYRDGRSGGDVVRYAFDDGSTITIHGAAWDLGYAGCYCWQGAGHSDDCREEVSR